MAERAPGQEVRDVDGRTLDPLITGRGWCDRCGGITAARTDQGVFRHRHCDLGISFTRYTKYLPGRRNQGGGA